MRRSGAPVMEPAFAFRVVLPNLDVLVCYVRVVPAEARDILLETQPSVFHERHCSSDARLRHGAQSLLGRGRS